MRYMETPYKNHFLPISEVLWNETKMLYPHLKKKEIDSIVNKKMYPLMLNCDLAHLKRAYQEECYNKIKQRNR
jgi:hypothetical protein